MGKTAHQHKPVALQFDMHITCKPQDNIVYSFLYARQIWVLLEWCVIETISIGCVCVRACAE